MKIKSLVLVALVLSMLFVLSVGVAAAAPGRPDPVGEGRGWSVAGENVKSFHADALGNSNLAEGRYWGMATSGR